MSQDISKKTKKELVEMVNNLQAKIEEYTEECPSCDGDGKCQSCAGKGICYYCKGKRIVATES